MADHDNELRSSLIDTGKREALLNEKVPDDIRQWLEEADSHYSRVLRILRKKNLEYSTLFEVISEIASRALNASGLLSYLVRTVRGQFACSRLLIFRKQPRPMRGFVVVAAEGMAAPDIIIKDSSPEVGIMTRYPNPTSFKDMDGKERDALKPFIDLELDFFVPLIVGKFSGNEPLQGFLMIGRKLGNIEYDSRELDFLTMIARMLAIAFQNETLFHLSSTDALTGVMSRGHFEALFGELLEDINNSKLAMMSVLMVDIDLFKKVNDTHGHPAGDRVLCEIAALMRNQIRPGDMVARYGGEEFVILLHGANERVAMQVADRIRQQIKNIVVPYSGKSISVTVSIGVASWPPVDSSPVASPEQLLTCADSALYRAKETRNAVALY